jgi:hypothetical protein
MEGVLNVVRRFDQVANGHYRLRRLAPVVFFVASGAILLDREDEGPVAIYYFSKVLPVASGPASDVPKGFADRLTEGASGPLLDEFRT